LVGYLLFEQIPGYQESATCSKCAAKKDDGHCEKETFDLTVKHLAISESQNYMRG
jgi:hypothetical protein